MPEPGEAAATKLVIHFQGLCAFVQKSDSPVDNEVCVLLLDPPSLPTKPALCRHHPTLTVATENINALPRWPRGRAVLAPLALNRSARYDSDGYSQDLVQILELRHFDLRVRGAGTNKLTLNERGPYPWSTSMLDLKDLIPDEDPEVLKDFWEFDKPKPPVAGRIFLSEGELSVAAVVKANKWALCSRGQDAEAGDKILYAQELRYEATIPDAAVYLELDKFGVKGTQLIQLKKGRTPEIWLGVTSLCSFTDRYLADGDVKENPDNDGEDVKAYHFLRGPHQTGKERFLKRLDKDATIGSDGCAPARMISKGG